MKRYRIGKLIATGGMAEIYEGWRAFPDGERPVVIKRIRAKHRDNQNAHARFLREWELCFEMNQEHPNLVTVYDFDQDNEGDFLVMERLQGAPLSELPHDRLSHPDVRRILLEMLNALAYIHSRGILHRDISPANVFITCEGTIKLIDFGLACRVSDKSTVPGFKGTAAFASPEALAEQNLTFSADLYSLGAVIYLLLAGSPPYGNGSKAEISNLMGVKEIADDEAIKNAPPDLRTVVTGLLQLDASQRPFGTARDVMKVLAEHRKAVSLPAALGDLALEAQARAARRKQAEPVPEPASARRTPGRRYLWIGAAAGLTALLWASVTQMLTDDPPEAAVHATEASTVITAEPALERLLALPAWIVEQLPELPVRPGPESVREHAELLVPGPLDSSPATEAPTQEALMHSRSTKVRKPRSAQPTQVTELISERF